MSNAFVTTSQPVTILVVDDDPLKRDVLKMFLTPDKYNLVEAGDGEEGLRLARQCAPALVIADLLMPRMDGHQFCKAIRNDPVLGKVPIAAYSGLDLDEIKAIASDCDINYVIPYTTKLGEYVNHVVEAALAGEPEPLALNLTAFVSRLELTLIKLKELSAQLPIT